MSSKDVEDLKAKLRILERKRAEDRDRLVDLERLRQERDKLERIIARLEGKIKPMFDTQQELRTRIRELEGQKSELETQLQELADQLESITLDREVAEAQEENMREELNNITTQLEEAILEIEVLREENIDKKNTSPGGHDSALLRQFEEQNEKLKFALVRLRDHSTAAEAELKADNKRLQREVEAYHQLQEKHKAAVDQLQKSEEIADNLRLQLDIAVGADKMIDELTVRNLALSEQIEELRASIQDLEMLKELNDEIEASHLEAAKQSQEEIDHRDLLLREQATKLAQIEESNTEYVYALGRYRELVASLQSELEQLRDEKSSGEIESISITRQSRELFDLNQKLQAASVRSQAKTIDLELRKLDAMEALEQLDIIRAYLPESLTLVRESVKTLLAFRRITFKSRMIVMVLKDRIQPSLDASLDAGSLTEILDGLTCVVGMCLQFTAVMQVCSVEDFEGFAPLLEDILPAERLLDLATEKLRTDSFRESEFTTKVEEILQLLKSLRQRFLIREEVGEVQNQRGLGMLLSTLSYIDSITLMTQSLLQSVQLSDRENVQNNTALTYEDELGQTFRNSADALISQTRSIKTLTSKISTVLDSWMEGMMSPTADILEKLAVIEEEARAASINLRNIYFSVKLALSENFEHSDAISYSQILKTLEEFRALEDGHSSQSTFYPSVSSALSSVIERSRQAYAAMSAGQSRGCVPYEKSEQPWIVKAAQLREQESINRDMKAKATQLREDILKWAAQLRMKEDELEESKIKINFLDSRLRKTTERLELLRNVEVELAQKKVHEVELENTVQSLRKEVATLEEQAVQLKTIAEENEAAARQIEDSKGQVKLASVGELEAMEKQILALQSTIRYLQARSFTKADSQVASTDGMLEYLHSHVNQARSNERDPAFDQASGIFDGLIQLSLSSEIIRVQGERTGGWRSRKSTPQYIVAKQLQNYRHLSTQAAAVSLQFV